MSLSSPREVEKGQGGVRGHCWENCFGFRGELAISTLGTSGCSRHLVPVVNVGLWVSVKDPS